MARILRALMGDGKRKAVLIEQLKSWNLSGTIRTPFKWLGSRQCSSQNEE
jgi:hypothetical protein